MPAVPVRALREAMAHGWQKRGRAWLLEGRRGHATVTPSAKRGHPMVFVYEVWKGKDLVVEWRAPDVETAKHKAAAVLLRDVDKLLNWSGVLLVLEGEKCACPRRAKRRTR